MFDAFQLYFFSLNQLTTIFGGICGLYSMFKSDGTIDKIFTGGAGKNGATVAVSVIFTSFSCLHALGCGFIYFFFAKRLVCPIYSIFYSHSRCFHHSRSQIISWNRRIKSLKVWVTKICT